MVTAILREASCERGGRAADLPTVRLHFYRDCTLLHATYMQHTFNTPNQRDIGYARLVQLRGGEEKHNHSTSSIATVLRSFCTEHVQLTSRLIEMRRARPPLALDLRDQHPRLRLPGVGSVVLNCRGVLQISYRYVIQALTRSLRPLFPIL